MDIDISSDWLHYNAETKESLVKFDQQYGSGKRIMVFSSDQGLDMLSVKESIPPSHFEINCSK